ncbi:sigma-70 family RNA polymerase sigma factor [Nocardiopsis sp. LOL_012]|uniref:sigma-70 family RNA polymerase sigma factor n=1 Tax=Nocardiopsis sp. LOL_012 TaxID=3345409 RepID=UPI003A878D38
MAFAPSPLEVVETHFVHLAPVHLTLHGGHLHPWLQDRPYTLYELRDVLMGESTPHEVRDAVWRSTIGNARHCQDWMVGALGLCMPALRSTARRTCRSLTPEGVEAVESAILAAALHQIRTIDTGYARLAWYLARRVHRAALSARKHERDAPPPAGLDVREPAADSSAHTGVEVLLVAAVRAGVLSPSEAHLIARTRLENVPLARAAAELGVSYKACGKRRERAEARLAEAVGSGGVELCDAFDQTEKHPDRGAGRLELLAGAGKVASPVSHRAFPLAS